MNKIYMHYQKKRPEKRKRIYTQKTQSRRNNFAIRSTLFATHRPTASALNQRRCWHRQSVANHMARHNKVSDVSVFG